MKTLIVIPMKNPRLSKQRLSGVLPPRGRQALALSMFEETLDFLRRHFCAYPVLVVTAAPLVADLARSYGAQVLLEPEATGLNGAAELAAQWSQAQGFETQLLMPADIAVLDVQEIRQLLELRWSTPWVAICPAADGGTNALVTSPPNALPFRFGVGSSRAHLKAALALGLHCVVKEMKNLAFDVDSPQDLEQLTLLPHRVPAQEVLNSWNR